MRFVYGVCMAYVRLYGDLDLSMGCNDIWSEMSTRSGEDILRMSFNICPTCR